jgi:uncharacterized protein YndB with AHSA1/START domain
MADIRHRVGVFVEQEKVYEALSTVEGLAQWWTHDVRGQARPGEELGFYFGGDKPGARMRVAELVASERVRWECVEGPSEWVGTTVTFDLYPGPAPRETVVKFTHAGWAEPVEFLHHCSTKWCQFLFSLKNGLESGAWQPFPGDPAASSWS